MFDFENIKFRSETIEPRENSLFSTALDTVMHGVVILTVDKKIVHVNRFVWSKVVKNPEDLLNKDFFKSFFPFDTEQLHSLFVEVERTKKMEKILRYKHDSHAGGEIFVDIYLYPVINSKNELIGYVFVTEASDVGKKYFRSNYKTDVFIRYVVNAMTEGATVIASNGSLEYANQRFFDMLGYDSSEMIGKHWMNWCYEGDVEQKDGKFSIKNRKQHGNVFIYRLRLKKKNGELLPVMMSVSKNVDSDFDIKSIGVIVDVSEQVKLEMEYKEMSEINRRILETITTGIVTIDKDLRIKFVNNQVEVMFGKSIDEVRGKGIGSMFPDLKFLEEWSSWVLRSLKPYQVDRYKLNLSLDERVVFLNVRIHPFYDRNNHISGVVCAFDDVSVSARLEEQIELSFRKLEITHAKLSDLLKRQRDFLADVSHELRTPLTVMSGNVEILKQNKMSTREDYEEVLDIVENELDKMTVMVKDLTTLINMEEGKIKLNTEDFEFSEIVRGLFVRLEGLNLKMQNVNISMEEDILVHGDKDKLGSVMWNLVENALKYSGDNAQVQVRLEKNDNILLVEVEDNGIGIPDDEKEYIFDRFYRVDKSRTRDKGGSGLGLSIVKWIVEAHKGTIKVESEVDKGTKFYLEIPIVKTS